MEHEHAKIQRDLRNKLYKSTMSFETAQLECDHDIKMKLIDRINNLAPRNDQKVVVKLVEKTSSNPSIGPG